MPCASQGMQACTRHGSRLGPCGGGQPLPRSFQFWEAQWTSWGIRTSFHDIDAVFAVVPRFSPKHTNHAMLAVCFDLEHFFQPKDEVGLFGANKSVSP